MKNNRKATAKSATIKRAKRILESQKEDYKRIFKQEVRKGGDSKKAAVRAGSVYRSRYGATATKRWENALKKAKGKPGNQLRMF